MQAVFRGFQVRRQYHKIVWSVGVLEKAILRWRLKRKGFRGLQVNTVEAVAEQRRESDTEEDFYKTSRKQAEERVERAVVRVQSMFRSKKAQKEYRRMKFARDLAEVVGFSEISQLPLFVDQFPNEILFFCSWNMEALTVWIREDIED